MVIKHANERGACRNSIFECCRMFLPAATGILLSCGLIVGPHRPCVAESVEDGGKKVPAAAAPAALAAKAQADVLKPVAGKNFVVLPVTTELQRACGPKYADAKVFVLINGMALLNEDETLNAAALDFQELRKAVKGFFRAGERGTTIYLACRLPPKDPNANPYGVLLPSVTGKVRSWPGKYWVTATVHYRWKYANKWDSFVADLTAQPPQGEPQDEPALGDDQVKVYPVRTPLSRYLYGDNVDCVIRIVPPIEEAKSGVVLTMKQCVDQLKLKQKRGVVSLEHTRDPAAANVMFQELFGEHVWKDLLGFNRFGRRIWH